MSIETHRVVIGACGWKHPAWLNNFYDEDLPEDWLLGFYSNEFTVVYVPVSDWVDEISLADWAEDINGAFRFILEISADDFTDSERLTLLLTKASALGEHCLGFVLVTGSEFFMSIEQFQSRTDMIQKIAPLCVDAENINLSAEMKTFLLQHNISEVWNGSFADTTIKPLAKLKRGSLAISRVSSENLTALQLRKVLEVCLEASTEECTSVLCFDGNPPSIEMMRNADIILNLL